VADRTSLKSGVGICGPLPQVKRLSYRKNEHFKNHGFETEDQKIFKYSIVAAHIESLRHPSNPTIKGNQLTNAPIKANTAPILNT
jgi:hypothetical protein